MTGKLKEESAAELIYDIDSLLAGGQLVIRQDSTSGRMEQLAAFGSGVPALWCIDSLLVRVWGTQIPSSAFSVFSINGSWTEAC